MNYKLIQTYPGQKILGVVAINRGKDANYKIEDENQNKVVGYVYADIIENNPEFWQPIPEKDYEVTVIRNRWNVLLHSGNHDKRYTSVDELYKQNSNKNSVYYEAFTVHTVKRLSDNVEFSVGDNTSSGIITQIYINQEKGLWLAFDTHGGYGDYSTLTKIEKIFNLRTKDGVDLYEGDTCFYVGKNVKVPRVAPLPVKYNGIFHFASKEKAEEWILFNTCKLSINEVWEEIKVGPIGLRQRLISLARSYNGS